MGVASKAFLGLWYSLRDLGKKCDHLQKVRLGRLKLSGYRGLRQRKWNSSRRSDLFSQQTLVFIPINFTILDQWPNYFFRRICNNKT